MCSWADDDDQAWQRRHAMMKADLRTLLSLRDARVIDRETYALWANRRILHYTQEQR